jgi:hypothetical protein
MTPEKVVPQLSNVVVLIVNWVKAAWQRLFGKKTAAPTSGS